ncbi:MAG TPA: lysylphosphatidylglycerol synthase transmembrane domain-containing protein [Candidatus Limnocylindrales bacterium]
MLPARSLVTAAPAPAAWVGHVRRLASVGISLVFVVLTLARVDIAGAASSLGRVAPLGLLVAIGLTGLELVLRAERWRRILLPFAPIGHRSALAYLSIGYFANTLLPARLGDVARAVLAGKAFGVPRLRILGTILLERVADGLVILAIVTVLALALPEARPLLETARLIALVGAGGVLALAVAVLLTHRTAVAATRLAGLTRDVIARLAEGLEALRRPAGVAVFGVLTVVAFFVAAAALLVVADALGIALSPQQGVLVMGALALSTAIPAAPGSIGTYEFVGLTTLTGLGVAPEPAIALVVLVHLVATLPPALAGLAATAVLHLRVVDLTHTAETARTEAPAGR